MKLAWNEEVASFARRRSSPTTPRPAAFAAPSRAHREVAGRARGIARALETSPRLATLYRMPRSSPRPGALHALHGAARAAAARLVRPRGSERHRDPRGILAAPAALRRGMTRGVGHVSDTVSDTAGTALVFGASGYIGSTSPRHSPRAAGACAPRRATSRFSKRATGRHRARPADALKPETLPAAVAASTSRTTSCFHGAGREFGRLDLDAADHFSKACAEAGVRRIVYLVDSSEGRRLRAPPVAPDTASGCAPHGSGHEIRAGIIVGRSAAFEVMRDLVLHLPVMITPRWVRRSRPHRPRKPSALSDRGAARPRHGRGIYDAGGRKRSPTRP